MTTNRSETMGLRAYQQKARQDIHKGFEEFNRQLGVLPTGAGKTILFSRLAQDYQPRRTLILAHREELITQAVDKLRVSTGIEAQVEMGEQRASLDAPVVVASVQTLMREKRRERWPRDHFGLVVVDDTCRWTRHRKHQGRRAGSSIRPRLKQAGVAKSDACLPAGDGSDLSRSAERWEAGCLHTVPPVLEW